MFSANENIALRKHKRRIVQLVEECIPEDVLDKGTNVMAMQITCNTPGCVPLETVIAIVFPRVLGKDKEIKQLMDGIKESKGGTYKTRILAPMSEITKDDVLDSLPSQFIGGRKTMEKLCYKVRDLMFNQILQVMGEEDVEGRSLLSSYLIEELQRYISSDCKAPNAGAAFEASFMNKSSNSTTNGDNVARTERKNDDDGNRLSAIEEKTIEKKGNVVIRRVLDEDDAPFVAKNSEKDVNAKNVMPNR